MNGVHACNDPTSHHPPECCPLPSKLPQCSLSGKLSSKILLFLETYERDHFASLIFPIYFFLNLRKSVSHSILLNVNKY